MMKKYFLLITLAIFSLCGCISKKSRIASVSLSKGIPFEGKIEGLFILINLPEDKAFSEKLAENLKEQFNSQGIKCESYVKTKLDLNSDKEFAAMATRAKASHMMTIDLSSQFYDGNYYKTSKFLSLTISDRQGKTQYTGSLSQDLRMIRKASQAKNDAMLIVEELNKNNLLKK